MHYTRFDTELIVRPDDIDMNNHVHNSKYLDYVLYARHDQMGRCYGMSMERFVEHGWNWFAKACHIEFKRPLNIGERIIIRTWIESFDGSDVTVGFQILKKESMKVSAEGYFINTMISISSGRAVTIPDWVLKQYTQFTT
jgi:acyl-CoA thioester hydrolase